MFSHKCYDLLDKLLVMAFALYWDIKRASYISILGLYLPVKEKAQNHDFNLIECCLNLLNSIHLVLAIIFTVMTSPLQVTS